MGEGRLEQLRLLLDRNCDYWMQMSRCHDEVISQTLQPHSVSLSLSLSLHKPFALLSLRRHAVGPNLACIQMRAELRQQKSAL